MKKSSKFSFVYPSVILFLLFTIFTVIVKFVDVQKIGETNTEVGLSSINVWFYNNLKYYSAANTWYSISEYLGYLALISPVVFACIGAYQLIKGKKLSAVDKRLRILAGFYVMVVCFYCLFETLVINNRPIFVDGVLEPSYPSSHTLLAICLLGSSIILFKRFISKKWIAFVTYKNIAITTMTLIVIGRLLSSMHWFTDIVGGIILSAALLSLLYSCIKKYEDK